MYKSYTIIMFTELEIEEYSKDYLYLMKTHPYYMVKNRDSMIQFYRADIFSGKPNISWLKYKIIHKDTFVLVVYDVTAADMESLDYSIG